jgi:hypothetical protein
VAWFDVEIDEVVDKAAGEIVLDEVDDNSVTDVDELDIRVTSFGLVDGLIDLLIVRDSLSKVSCCFFRILAGIVGRRGLHFQDVAHNQFFVVAF